MRVITVNEEALIKAATFIVGQDATNAIINLYQMLDTTEKNAFDLGRDVGASQADEAAAEAWDLGYDQGEADGSATADAAYVQGVTDARTRPEQADETVAVLAEKSLLDAVEEDDLSARYCAECGGDSCELCD